MSILIKLALFVALPVLLVVGFIVGTPQVLSIDDLAGCSGPTQTDPICQPADVIVAISGGDTDARAREAISLYKQGWAPSIIFSGAAQDKSGTSNAAAMANMAIADRVPTNAILLDQTSVNTVDNASHVRAIVQSHGFKRLILVTSPYHQRRASIEFNRQLGDIATIINHPTPSDKYWPADTWWMTPTGVWLGVSELVKVMYVSFGNG